MLKNVTDASFEQDVLKASGPVLVDFWAEWCGPCKQIAPALDDIARDMEGQLDVAKVDITDNPDAPGRYGVTGIPMLMIFKDGEPIATQRGALPPSQLQKWVKDTVASV